jgi:hypothetical protein
MSDDWEYSDDSCPKCGEQMSYRQCTQLGCGWDDDDDEWPTVCDNCRGMEYEEWCRSCGWDNVFKCFLNPKCKAEYEAKQAEAK